jgi:hypothetical protein
MRLLSVPVLLAEHHFTQEGSLLLRKALLDSCEKSTAAMAERLPLVQ